jgi:nucleotide-binding universal stress UspA family protein
MSAVIAAIDLGPTSGRVLQHAGAFAKLWSTRLRVMHVTASPAEGDHQRVVDFCARSGPYEIDLADEDVTVRSGLVSDAIYREARGEDASLVVMGSHQHGALAGWLLGTTTTVVLQNAASPVLLVPPTDLDIVDISERPRLTCGPVLAAVDLQETGARQLEMAAAIAETAGQPLLLMTVAAAGVTDHSAARMLHERAQHYCYAKPHAVIVRRGRVAEEISRCAVAEGAGLVVMGLRKRPRGQPGAIATAVLRTNRAFVLAVPGR